MNGTNNIAGVNVVTRSNDDISTVRPTATYAAGLMNQQVWCWGRDIEYPDGNLLLQYGFQRIEKPAESNAASVYRLELSSTSRIMVRGFGAFIGDDDLGGLFLPRFEFTPQLTPHADLTRLPWSKEDLPQLAHPKADQCDNWQRLLLNFINWVQRYEAWITDNVGAAYRKECLLDWKETVPAEQMNLAWRLLAATVLDHPDRYLPCVRDSVVD